ncbi:PREDICTED: VIP peptides [Gekko japonicus]|uniref:VIP peptides n=1 Tax=Gekko japonicus TaxID=146911 RepID=A0ABM1JUC3_GEKJA|nr:PREDICTED: VIP peptides [Gekko japonicus]
MDHRSGSQLPLSFILLCILCSRALALPPLESYSAMRLGNRIPFDGASESDQAPLKLEADILHTLTDNDKFYYDVPRAMDRNKRHADGLFTSGYSKLLGQLSARRYLESLIGKRIGNNSPVEEEMPVKRHSDAVFTDNYSRLRKLMAAQKYLNSILTGKRGQEELNNANLPDETELLEPVFSENYDGVTVDDLLNHFELVVHQEQNKLFMKEWSGYGFTLFDVECKEGGFPNDLWLSVSTENVSVCELWKLSSIVFSGTLQPNTFKLTVDEREMFFETPQVGEIIKTMKAYRDMTVKKCYSIKSAANLDSCASFWTK